MLAQGDSELMQTMGWGVGYRMCMCYFRAYSYGVGYSVQGIGLGFGLRGPSIYSYRTPWRILGNLPWGSIHHVTPSAFPQIVPFSNRTCITHVFDDRTEIPINLNTFTYKTTFLCKVTHTQLISRHRCRLSIQALVPRCCGRGWLDGRGVR